MADLRRYTGTRTLQSGWTLLVLVVGAAVVVGNSLPLPSQYTIAAFGLLWLLGLIIIGWRDRRTWARMVQNSSFEAGSAAHTADLQKIIRGQSVTVTTDVAGIIPQAHTILSANIEGVGASFTIRILAGTDSDDSGNVTTGNETLDDRFAFEGSAGNLKSLLSTDVQSALMDVDTPGTFTITGERVTYEIPFTNLRSDELEAAGTAVALIADRIETVGKG